MHEEEHTEETCVIVEEVNNMHVGVIVDSVSEVVDIGRGDIEETPKLEQGIDKDFMMGPGKVNEKIIILLDIERVLTSEKLEMLISMLSNSHKE